MILLSSFSSSRLFLMKCCHGHARIKLKEVYYRKKNRHNQLKVCFANRNIKFTILFIYFFLLSFFIFSVTLPSVRISLPFFYCHLVLGLTPGLFTQHGCCGCMDSNTQRTRLQCTLVWEWSLDMKKLIVSFNWPLLTGFLLLHVRSWPNKKPAMHF